MLSKLLSCHSYGDTSSSSSRRQPRKLNVTAYFTEHLISEILSCLPVKTLLRFRCVSKPWCSLIDSPRFVKTHLKRSIECKTNIGVFINSIPSFYLVDFDSIDKATAIEIDEPLKTLPSHCPFVGSYNGLLCLYNLETDILLWNPATRKCRKLPAVPTEFLCPFDFGWSSLCGFGYDAINDDYKVLEIYHPDGHDLAGSMVIVYSLKTNSWRRLLNIPSHFKISGMWGMFICGALHWLTTKTLGLESCSTILAFDLGHENYREVPMPKVQDESYTSVVTFADESYMSIVTFAESLTMLKCHLHNRVDVWVMNDYGVENSWSKLFSVKHSRLIRSLMSVKPLAYSKSRRDILFQVHNQKLIWYNLESKKARTVKIANMPNIFELEVYTKSLVSPDYNFSCEGKQQPLEKKKQKQQRKENERDKFLSKGFKLVL